MLEDAPLTVGSPAGPTLHERRWMVGAHALAAVSGWLGPLIVLETVGHRSSWVRAQAAEALNFQVTMAVVAMVAGLLSPWAGLIPLFVVVGVSAASALVAAGTAGRRRYRYPVAWRPVQVA